jgi:hypothetical protein
LTGDVYRPSCGERAPTFNPQGQQEAQQESYGSHTNQSQKNIHFGTLQFGLVWVLTFSLNRPVHKNRVSNS